MSRLADVFRDEHPVALVTGSGAARVGHAVLQTFAARGYRCIVHYNTSKEDADTLIAELRAEKREAVAIQANLSQAPEVRRLINEAYNVWQRLDVLVNCAAIWQPQSLEDTKEEDVRRHFDINTLATFIACQTAGLKMAAQPTGGAIINIGDWAVARPYLNYPAYFASKGCIPTLTRDFAVELASRNPRVRVNAILPGPVMLPPDLSAEERQQSISGTLVKREGSPEHIADAAVFLAENDFITGVCLPVDGGRTIA